MKEIKAKTWVWMNGRLRPANEAVVSVGVHALHYGSSVFEGVRSFDRHGVGFLFRLLDHIDRLYKSAKVYRMEIPFEPSDIASACREVVAANRIAASYIRPIVFRGVGGMAIGAQCPIEVAVMAIPAKPYFGRDVGADGISACISSWRRPPASTVPAGAKAGGNYLGSWLMADEARANGCDEAIALSYDGFVSEGAGANVLLVEDKQIVSPCSRDGMLDGITRKSLITLAKDSGVPIIERTVAVEELYGADEVLLCGTAVGVTPVISVNKRRIGNGSPGTITRMLQVLFMNIVNGAIEDKYNWLLKA